LSVAFDKIRVVRRLATLATDSGSLQVYLREIAKFPRLDSTQERELGERIQQGDEQALTTLVGSHLRFVVSYARRYRRLGVPFLDLIHEGNWGIIEAARCFNPDRDGPFVDCAVWWIRQAMLRAVDEAAENRHLLALGPAPADAGLGGRPWVHSGDTGVELANLLLAQSAHEIDDELTRAALVDELEIAMEELDPTEREVMRLRYGLCDAELWTLQQVGARLRVTRDRVRQIEARAVQKLRRRRRLRSQLN
jgi:RNA polymerase primary sigma factor